MEDAKCQPNSQVPLLPPGTQDPNGSWETPSWGAMSIPEVGEKLKNYLYKDSYSSMIPSEDNLEMAQMPNKRGLVTQTSFYQMEGILLLH